MNKNRPRRFKINALTLALATCFAGVVGANPQAPTVVAGQAAIQQNGKTLSITNTPGAIINWRSFNIDRGELTRFIQQNAQSSVLNRVTGVDPSKILGNLQSNGRVLLINPNGVLFGKDARVDVAGLLVSTLQIKDADFLAGKYKFNDTPGAGKIENQGSIQTASGGQVILIAPQIENSGLIHAPEGQILLAAGKSVTIADPDKPAIQVEITNSEQKAVNLGSLIAKEISIYGGLIKNTGLIQATTAQVGANGKISLRAKYEVESTGTIQANGAVGGDVLIQALEGTATVGGLVEAKGLLATVDVVTKAKLLADAPETGHGGRIEILAPAITVAATVDASGTQGGGAILIGGEYQGGKNPVPADWSDNLALKRASLALSEPFATSPSLSETSASVGSNDPLQQLANGSQNNPALPNRHLPTARIVTITGNARIRSDALVEGNGGVVVAWADETARVAGSFSVRGSGLSGNGGLIETSAHAINLTGATVDARAANGTTGQWLIDPVDFTIAASGGDMTGADLSSALNTAAVIILSSSGANGAAGDINVNDAVSWSANLLTLRAAHSVNVNAVMTATGTAKLSLYTSDGASAVVGGEVRFGFNTDGSFKGRVDFGGTGTFSLSGLTYNVISSLAGLQGMSLTGRHVLGNDIDLSSLGTGSGFTPLGAFSGRFSGLGHRLAGLYINLPSTSNVGLFSLISSTGVVAAVGLSGVQVSGNVSVGALAGVNQGTVVDAWSSGSVTGVTSVGGLLGNNQGAIKAAHSAATVSATQYSGGLVGALTATSSNSATITDSYATGSVSGTHRVGGLVGGIEIGYQYSNAGIITGSYATGSVSGSDFVGGLVGYNSPAYLREALINSVFSVILRGVFWFYSVKSKFLVQM